MTLFYVFAAVAVVASLLVIAQRNPIYSVLLLIASFGALSGLRPARRALRRRTQIVRVPAPSGAHSW
jgi:NADH:ubiquinone oxidoreductase subunit 6 (subunit J)